MNQYFGMVTSQTFVPHTPAMTTVPISLRLREHHCINPEPATAAGGSSTDALDDGITNAWFPSDVNIREVSDGVRIDDPRNGGSSAWYERYREGKENSHNEETCTQCSFRKQQEQYDLDERIREHKRASEERDEEEMTEHDFEYEFEHEHEHEHEYEHEHDDEPEGSHSSDTHNRAPRHPAMSPTMRRRPHEQGAVILEPGVTRPDGPSSGVDPAADIRTEFSEALGRDVEMLLDEEMQDEHEDTDSDWEEYVENTCNGIQDIIITGEVSAFRFLTLALR